MNLLPDTHLLLWLAIAPERLSREAVELLSDSQNKLFFSAVSIWETAIKNALGKDSFQADARQLRNRLLEAGYREISLNSDHALAVLSLPAFHKDPFDRILIAQATVEGITLLTSDRQVAKYPGPIRKI